MAAAPSAPDAVRRRVSALFVSHRHGFPALFMADLGTDELLQCTARRDLNPWSVRTCSSVDEVAVAGAPSNPISQPPKDQTPRPIG